MTQDDPLRPRRVRYKGTHPRRFAEKYKELAPEQHAEELEKVLARGHTPAGTHRSIMVGEILAVLAPKPSEVALDATLGYGGHTRELLPRLLPGAGSSVWMWIPWSCPARRPDCGSWATVRTCSSCAA